MHSKTKTTISILIVSFLFFTSFNACAKSIFSENLSSKITCYNDNVLRRPLFQKEKDWKWNINGYWNTDVPGDWDIVVPCTYPTIQEAIKSANVGDRIFVREGVYDENLEINVDGIILQGENRDNTIVRAVKRDGSLKINASNVKVSGFTFTNSGYRCAAVNLQASSRNIIQDNKIISNKGHGIQLYHSHGNTIADNIIANNRKNGITLTFYSLYNTIKNNDISDNRRCGIFIDEISRINSFFGNEITENKFGVKCLGSSCDNFFHHNNFVDNTMNVYDSSSNWWDDGDEGNYWDDYIGIDIDEDGIGDIPYDIISGGSNYDGYPLMNPVIPPIQETKSILQIIGSSDTCFSGLLFETGNIITVDDDGDGDYYSIQEAVDNANPGDTIGVYSGTYKENIVMDTAVILKGISEELGSGYDTGKPIVDGDGSGCVFILTADCVQMSGFEIKNTGLEYAGIKIHSDFNIIENNHVSNCGDGISIWDSNRNLIINNTIKSNNFGVYSRISTDSQIVNNTFEYNDDGIVLFGSSVEIKENLLKNNTYNGILGQLSDNVIIVDNDILYHSKFGIQFFSCNNNILKENKVAFNLKTGISLYNSNNNMVTNNVIEKNLEGVSLYHSANNIISRCEFIENHYGIDVSFSHNNNINENNIINSSSAGIYIGMSKYNTLRSNVMINCGVMMDGYSLSSWWNDVDQSNTVNGKIIYYYINETGLTISPDAGQVILVNCSYCTITDLATSNVSVGVEIAYSNNINIYSNLINHIHMGIILFHSTNSTISDNFVTNSKKVSIALYWSSNYNYVSRNFIYNNSDEVGIALESSDYNVIEDNNIEAIRKNIKNTIDTSSVIKENKISIFNIVGSSDTTAVVAERFFFRIGISLGVNCNSNFVNNNYIRNMSIGIAMAHVLYTQEGNKIMNNILIDNEEGIAMGYTRNNYIINNTIYNSTFAGIALDWLTDNNYIVGNNITKGFGGIGLRTCNNNLILRNNISGFEYMGIFLWYSANNRVQCNNFFSNKRNAGFNNAYNTIWDGNYWDNWIGLRHKLFKRFPKLIRGGINIINNKTPYVFFRMPIPWFNFDKHPSDEMNIIYKG